MCLSVHLVSCYYADGLHFSPWLPMQLCRLWVTGMQQYKAIRLAARHSRCTCDCEKTVKGGQISSSALCFNACTETEKGGHLCASALQPGHPGVLGMCIPGRRPDVKRNDDCCLHLSHPSSTPFLPLRSPSPSQLHVQQHALDIIHSDDAQNAQFCITCDTAHPAHTTIECSSPSLLEHQQCTSCMLLGPVVVKPADAYPPPSLPVYAWRGDHPRRPNNAPHKYSCNTCSQHIFSQSAHVSPSPTTSHLTSWP